MASVQQVKAMLTKSKGRVRNVSSKELRTYKGIVYDSRAECLYAFELDKLKAAGKILDWSRQVRIPLVVNGTVVCHMVIDFCISQNDGQQEFHEIKGWSAPEFKLKLKLFKAIFPKATYKLVKV